MSQRDQQNPARPLSPHLQIWRWGPHMLVSILHRATGDGMALVGLPLLVWWLAAAASGPEAYASFQSVMGSPLGLIVLVGISWAFFQHLTSVFATSCSTSAQATSSTPTAPGRWPRR